MRRVDITTFLLAGFLALPGSAYGGDLKFKAELTTAQAVGPPPVMGLIGQASVAAAFDGGFTEVDVKLKVNGGDNVFAVHFHCALPGANGPIALGIVGPLVFDGMEAKGVLTNADFGPNPCDAIIGRPVNNIAALALAMRAGLIYLNVHTDQNPAGEVRGQMLEKRRR